MRQYHEWVPFRFCLGSDVMPNDAENYKIGDLYLRYMQVALSIQAATNLPGSRWPKSFMKIEFISMIERTNEGLICYVKFEFEDSKVLYHNHEEMEILEIKSKAKNSALVKILLTGPIPSLFIKDSDPWWVNPTYLTSSGMTMTLRGTKAALQRIRNDISKIVGTDFSIKLGSETLQSPEFIDMLNEKQRLVLDMAVLMGYYSRPRRCTQRGIAEVLNIKQATVSEHLQLAESKIIHLISNYAR
jgi:hypothetical protein